ncbi:MAG: hypothetical protein NTY19_05885 [Planctomycetota bacterium]|nr:hypothetical protein [Planctomycetota bacterium]
MCRIVLRLLESATVGPSGDVARAAQLAAKVKLRLAARRLRRVG